MVIKDKDINERFISYEAFGIDERKAKIIIKELELVMMKAESMVDTINLLGYNNATEEQFKLFCFGQMVQENNQSGHNHLKMIELLEMLRKFRGI
jgi:hypothetical protein